MLIDALRLVGLDALAQVDLGTRQNRHQPLRALSAMAVEVMVAVERRNGGLARPARPASGPGPGEEGAAEKLAAALRGTAAARERRVENRGLTAPGETGRGGLTIDGPGLSTRFATPLFQERRNR